MTSGWSERNPFSDNPGPFGFPPPSPPPLGPQPSSSRIWVWVLVALAITLGGGALVCCGGGLGVFYWGRQLGPQITPQIRNNPTVREHLGEVQSCDWDLAASAEEEGADTMVFNVRGSKGTGVLIAETESTEDGERIISARLLLPDGQEVIVVESPKQEPTEVPLDE